MISEISKAALRMDQQVENLLNISRLESGHIQPKYDWTDITETIHDVVRRSEELHPKYRIQISIPPTVPLCYIDKGMFDQIIFNLLNNACVHNEPSTVVLISAVEHGGLLHVTIEDNGKGIDRKEVLEKLSRNAKPIRNAGLGLSIVKGFTEALQGEVQIENVVPQGVRFVIVIPVKTTTG
jgi:two-component system sensor histidine kinase KdpD